ncbi:FAD-dependent protein [Roseburia hominis]
MIRVSQLKIRTGHTREELFQKLLHVLSVQRQEVESWKIRKQSLDARKKPELYYVYTIDVKVKREGAVLKRIKGKRRNCEIGLCTEMPYVFPEAGTAILKQRPIIVGCGPAGLFAAYFLAREGYAPLVIERGAPVEERARDVEEFWERGVLKPDSNVQFGEGGAGTFSDGKLNTLVKDPAGRIRKVLEVFVEMGAPEEILYVNKPHIGTDVLRSVIRSMREQIISWGGEFSFHTTMTELDIDSEGSIRGIYTTKGYKETRVLILAPGHSARDTFAMLYEKNVPMESKAFAVGVRVEHSQELINNSQYGEGYDPQLPAAAYKLTAKLENGRGVYSFCMCPGGYVVNASSEEGHLAVNGMSYHARDSRHANSAIVVTVSPEDYKGEGPLAGIAFQRELERAAYLAGNGKIPVQRYGDFAGKDEEIKGASCPPDIKGAYCFADVRKIFPEEIAGSIVAGMEKFNDKIRGFSHPDTLLLGVESRTSSPVRILRGDEMESTVCGLYPCGEGAGYAGGITSAAVDGMKIAEKIRRKYAPFDNMTRTLRKI